MSTRQLRRIRGNKVFDVANQLGLLDEHENDDPEEDPEVIFYSSDDDNNDNDHNANDNEDELAADALLFDDALLLDADDTAEHNENVAELQAMKEKLKEMGIDTAEIDREIAGQYPRAGADANANEEEEQVLPPTKKRKKKKKRNKNKNKNTNANPDNNNNSNNRNSKSQKNNKNTKNTNNKRGKKNKWQPQKQKQKQKPTQQKQKQKQKQTTKKQKQTEEKSNVEAMPDIVHNIPTHIEDSVHYINEIELQNEICSDWRLFICDIKYFDPNFELRQKFGDVAVDDDDGNNEDEYQRAMKNLKHIKNKKHKRMQRKYEAKQKQMNNKFKHLKKRQILAKLIKFNESKWPKPYAHLSKLSGNIFMNLTFEYTPKRNRRQQQISNNNSNNNNNSIKFFEFVFDSDYKRVQFEYKQRCSRFNPEEISFFLQQNPYHVDTCLTMAEILKKHGQKEESSDLVERALYRLESGLHSRFSLSNGDCRLNYNCAENKCFFLSLFRYLQNAGRRGCVHTSFELSKCLLSLSPVIDPLCILLVLDYWALRSMEYMWILRFGKSFQVLFDVNYKNGKKNAEVDGAEEEEEEIHCIRMYPNWCYSIAFAKYKMELQTNKSSDSNSSDVSSVGNDTNTGYVYQFGDCDEREIPLDLNLLNIQKNDGNDAGSYLENEFISSSILIQQAILLFPEMIGPLLSKANERVLKQSKWHSVFNHSYFVNAKMRREEVSSLNKLCRIYAEQCHTLWNSHALIDWVYKHCLFVLQKLDGATDANPGKDAAETDGETQTQTETETETSVDERKMQSTAIATNHQSREDLSLFNLIREGVYGIEKLRMNKFTHLDVHDFSDVLTTLPVEELPDAVMRAPAMNLDLNALQNLDGEQLNRVVDQLLAADIDIPPEIQQRLEQGHNIQNQNVLMAMLYSLMPWVNPIIPDHNNNNQNNGNNNANNGNANQ